MLTVGITAITIFIFVIVFATEQILSEGIRLSQEKLGADCIIVSEYSQE